MPRGHKVLSCAQETLRPLRNARSRSRNIESEVLGSGAVMSRKMAMPSQTRRISALLRSAAALGPFLIRAGESLDTPPGAVGFFGFDHARIIRERGGRAAKMQSRHLTFADGHTESNTPDLF